MRRMHLVLIALLVVVFGVVAAQALTVYDIQAYPNVLQSYTYFTATEVPSQYELDEIEIKIYNLASQLVATLTEEDVYRIYWNGGGLANGVYTYVASYTNLNPDMSDEFGPYVLYILR
ncbi:hypothetical protein KJ567_04600 [Candidatus Bipolaricaulota bacterium]|nr:hypothetical protein [Candidatus Bipolaricaulota bacterium]